MDAMRFLRDHGSGCPERGVSAKLAGHASTSLEEETDEHNDVTTDSRIDSENQSFGFFSSHCFSSSPYFQSLVSSFDTIYSILTQSADVPPREERLPREVSASTTNVLNDQGEPPMEIPVKETMVSTNEALESEQLSHNH